MPQQFTLQDRRDACAVLTVAIHGNWDEITAFTQDKTPDELHRLIVALASVSAGALIGAMNTPIETWLPALCLAMSKDTPHQ